MNQLLFYIFLFFALSLKCQYAPCNRTSGPPIFQETFGRNASIPSFGPELPPNKTTYKYIDSFPPAKGEYCITNKTNNTNGWEAITDPKENGGYMMVVNADLEEEVFYSQRIDNLCEDQVYEFSAWFFDLNIKPGTNRPEVKFEITDLNNNKLPGVSIQVGTGTNLKWFENIMTFQVPKGINSIYITFRNVGKGGLGNDLAIDDIQFRKCIPYGQIESTNPDIFNNPGVCSTLGNIKLTANFNHNYVNPEYLWQKSSDNGASWTNVSPLLEVNEFTNIQSLNNGDMVRVIIAGKGNTNEANCRFVSQPKKVFLVKTQPPKVKFSEIKVCLDEVMLPLSAEGTNLKWYKTATAANPSSVAPTPDTSKPGTQSYWVSQTINGCESSREEISVTVYDLKAAPKVLFDNNECWSVNPKINEITFGNYSKDEVIWEDSSGKIITDKNIALINGATYILYVKNDMGCKRNETIFKPKINLIPSLVPVGSLIKEKCVYDEVELAITTDKNNEIIWLDTDNNFLVRDTDKINVKIPGKYRVIVKRDAACEQSLTFEVKDKIVEASIEASSTSFIYGETITLTIKGGEKYNWDNGETSQSIQVTPTKSTTYSVEVTENGCIKRLSIDLKLTGWILEYDSRVVLCAEETIMYTINGAPDGTEFSWSNGKTGNTILLDKTESLILTTTYDGITQLDNIEVWVDDLSLEEKDIEGCLRYVSIFPTKGTPPYFYSLDGFNYQISNEFINVPKDQDLIYVKDSDGCVVSSPALFTNIFIPELITPNNDGINDQWQIKNIDNCKNAQVKIIDRYQRTLFEGKATSSWNWKNNNTVLPQGDYWYILDFNDGYNRPLIGNIHLSR